MATMLSSKAFFKERAIECGLSEAQLARLEEQNLATARAFAFAVPRDGAEAALLGVAASIIQPPEVIHAGLVAILRGLHFEAYTLYVADWRSRVERQDRDDTPRRLPLAERNSRRVAQMARLAGVRLEGVHDPSHMLIDKIEALGWK